MPKTAYSYIRFSTLEQEKGDSINRQTKLSVEYAEEHGLILDTELKMTDHGVTAYTGDNVTKGALGAFIKAVDEGRVETGSYLLVESLDRLSRQKVIEALSLFISILDKGIVIVTLTDGKKYEKGLEDMDLMMSILIMSRAHEESRRKGERIKAAWETKRANIHYKKLTKWSPKWVHLSENREEFICDEKRAELIKKIYEWSAKGLGTWLIIKRIEEIGIEPWDMGKDIKLKDKNADRSRAAKRWHGSYIQRVLHDRSVLGEYKLKLNANEYQIIDNYYPRIISNELFYRVKAARESRNVRTKGTGAGRKGKYFSNLFSGIAYCGYSSESSLGTHKCAGQDERMVYSNKGNGLNYLQCSRTKNGNSGCELCRKLWRYDSFETSFLAHVSDVDVSILLGSNDSLVSEIQNLKEKVQARQGSLIDVKAQITLLKADMDRAHENREQAPRFVFTKGAELEQKQDDLMEEIERLKSEIIDREHRYTEIAKQPDQILNLIQQMGELTGRELFDFRMELSELLKQTIVRIDVYSKGMIKDERFFEKMKKELGDEAVKLTREYDEMTKKSISPFFYVRYKSGAERIVGVNPKKPLELQMTAKWDGHGETIEQQFKMLNIDDKL